METSAVGIIKILLPKVQLTLKYYRVKQCINEVKYFLLRLKVAFSSDQACRHNILIAVQIF